LGIELLDPRRIERTHRDLWETSGWNYGLDYPWIISKVKAASYILDVGCYVKPYSPIADYLVKTLGADCTGIDRKFGIEFMNYKPTRQPDVILWASSIEHNKPDEMRKLYLRSMEMLKPGGMFIATIAISKDTTWFSPSVQTNLNIEDAKALFDEPDIIGDFEDVRQAYRSDKELVWRYTKRYGHWVDTDPLFIAAGVVKCK
jgi:hypothetical protein